MSYALSRVEAYVVVGLVFISTVVAIIGQWPLWVIGASVLGGALLLLLLVADSLSDPHAERAASLVDVDASRVADAALRAKVRRALDYVRTAQKIAKRDTAGVLDAADDELPQMENAARSIYQMCLRLQDFRADRLLRQDLASLRQQARQGVMNAAQEGQLRSLERLDALVLEAEQEVEASLANLGQSYAEMQAIKVTPELRGRAADAFDQLAASTKRLAELAEGYDEAWGARTTAAGS